MTDRFEIILQQTSAGWHWTIATLPADESPGKVIADSFEASPTAIVAAGEASAEIAEPGRALRRFREAKRRG